MGVGIDREGQQHNVTFFPLERLWSADADSVFADLVGRESRRYFVEQMIYLVPKRRENTHALAQLGWQVTLLMHLIGEFVEKMTSFNLVHTLGITPPLGGVDEDTFRAFGFGS